MDKKKILIIDDEKDFCFFVKANLENTGEFEVSAANSGKEGIGIALREKPDLVLLDISMPGMSGDQVAQILSRESVTNKIPIVFLTALVTEDEIETGVVSSIAGHKIMAKPVATAELVGAINNTLN